MKKILFFIAMVAITVAMASAQVAVNASGDATTCFGLDIDEMDTGFTYEGSADIDIAFDLDMDSASSAVDDGDTVYGEFSISDIELVAEYPSTATYTSTNAVDSNGDEVLIGGLPVTADVEVDSNYVALSYDSIAAKIVIGDLTINLYDAPSTAIDYNVNIANAYNYPIFDERYGAGDISKDNDDDVEFTPTESSFAVVGLPAAMGEVSFSTNAGVQAIYAIPDIMDIELDVKSYDPWSDQTTENAYAFKIGVDVKAVENLTLAGAVIFSGKETDYLGVGGKVGYSIMLGEEDSVTPTATIMFVNDSAAEDSAIGITAGLNVSVAGLVLTANMGTLDGSTETDDSETWAAAIALDASGLVDGLTAQAAIEMDSANFLDDYPVYTAIHGKLGYAIASGDLTITPAAEVSMMDYTEIDDEEELYAKVYVTVDGLIDNVQFKLHWDSNDLMEHDADALAHGTMGQIVLDTKVSL
jgi:hypothetical protein